MVLSEWYRVFRVINTMREMMVLTEVLLKSLKPKEKGYKLADKEGLYIYVSKTGAISFRYNYKINGRQETYTFGVWKKDLSLAEARARLVEVKKMVASGESPMLAKKAVEKYRGDFIVGEWVEKYMNDSDAADSTKKVRSYVINNHIMPRWKNWQLEELSFSALRHAVDEIDNEGAPATAIQLRNIMVAVFNYAIDRGYTGQNIALRIKPSSIHTFKPRERCLSEQEIATLYFVFRKLSSNPQMKHAIKLLLLTLLRKSELLEATWDEIDFENAVWTIPADRMKMDRAHNVYLSRQAVDLLLGLQLLANGSKYVLPARGNPNKHMGTTSLNRVCRDASKAATDYGLALDDFSPHDLRRTGDTILNERGYDEAWIEKTLAHEQVGVKRHYNKAQYEKARREMMQDWADMIDSFCEKYADTFDKEMQFKSVRQMRMERRKE